MSETEALEAERNLLGRFKKEAGRYLSAYERETTKDTLSWWTIMQHHGAPTRLLDWTGSIYIAAYFAAIGNPDLPGSITVLDPSYLRTQSTNRWGDSRAPTEADIQAKYCQPNAPPSLDALERISPSERMILQQGGFTVSRNVMATHDQELWDVFPVPSKHLRRVVIPAELKPEFLRQLQTMNVDSRTIFPGIDGLGTSAFFAHS